MDSARTTPVEPETGPVEWACRLTEVRDETPTVKTFFFEFPETPLSFRPGQYFALRTADLSDPRGDSRTFSASSAPSDRTGVSITTRIGPSPFKQRLFSSAPGSKFELWGPFGNFTLDPDRRAVLVGGGIGITPFRSMIRDAAHRRSPAPIVLLYSSRTVEEIVYRSEFEALAGQWPGLRLMLTVSRPEESRAPWKGSTGHIDGPRIRHAIRDLERPLYYVCGPPPMVKELHRVLMREAGVPAGDVRTELFQGY
ncbi:MAG: ferredoxin--NADP reductase [Thermoplasmata archaeon]